MTTDKRQPLRARTRNPLLRLLSSIWFGMTLLALIVVYSSLMSAVPLVRASLEMTEMEAYQHWIFVGLVLLLALSLLAATFFRTRWIWINAGALTTHFGLLLLMTGALFYFGTKIEGDVLLQTPSIRVRVDIQDRSAIIGQFPAHEGFVWAPPGTPVRMTVLETQADGIQPVATARVRVELGDEPPRDLLLSGGSRGEATSWETIRPGLSIGLFTFPAVSAFYERDQTALYIRDRSRSVEFVRRIRHLPRYWPRYLADVDPLVDAAGQPVPSGRQMPGLNLLGVHIPTGWFEPWRLPINVDTDDLPFELRIVGYLPHVVGFRPVARPGSTPRTEPIIALPANRQSAGPAICVEVAGRGAHSGWSTRQWCLFSPYPELEASVLPLKVPGGEGNWELVYSRPRQKLEAELVGHKLILTYFPGRRGIESYRSDFMIREGTHDEPHKAVVQTNKTLSVGPWTLYQSSYDADDHWRYTVLGVTNRNGILLMNVGWVLVTLGCIYAFYVKPVLVRRARRRTGVAEQSHGI